MADEEFANPWDVLAAYVKKVPKEENVWLYMFMLKPHKGPLGTLYIDRNNDLREQVKERLEEKEGLRDFVEMKVNVRSQAAPKEFGSAVVRLPLKTALPATPATAERQANPGAAGFTVDTSSIENARALLRQAAIARYGECKECQEPNPDCTCEEEEEEEADCATCGLPESECPCDDSPGILVMLAGEPDVRNAFAEMLRNIGRRALYGISKTPPPPEVDATNEAAPFTVHEGGKKQGGTE